MHSTRLSLVYFFAILIGMYLLSAYVQSLTLICGDVSWEVHEARRMLAGTVGGDGLFELTPPLFLLWYIPPVLLTAISSMTIMHAVQWYVFFLISISLSICYPLVSKIFSKDIVLSRIFFLAIAATFLLLPMSADVGQREHFLLYLSVPYLLLVAYRLPGGSIHPCYALLIGMLAGLGFAIKPFFMMVPLLVELYVIFYKRSLLAWLRIETIAMLAILLMYSVCIWMYFPTYFLSVVPLVSRVYYGYSFSWKELIQLDVLFSVLVLIGSLFCYRNNPYKALYHILSVAMVGFLSCYFIQKTTWFYHLLPAYSMAVLLVTLCFSQLVRQDEISRWSYTGMVILGGLACGLLSIYCPDLWTVLVFTPKLYFTLFAVMFFMLACVLQTKKWVASLFIIGLVLLTGFCFTNFLRTTSWVEHRFLLTTVLMILVYAVLIAENRAIQGRSLFIVASGIILLAFPFCSLYSHYGNQILYKKISGTLIQFMHENAKHKPVYFISTMAGYEFPAVDYAEVIPVSRYQMLFWVPGYLKKMQTNISNKHRFQLMKDHQYFVETVANELDNNKPLLVFVDVIKHKAHMENIQYNFLDDFSQYPKFNNAWKAYRYLTTVQEGSAYQFQVYQRAL